MLSKKEKRVKDMATQPTYFGEFFPSYKEDTPVKIEFNDNFAKHRGNFVEIHGVLSKITPPYDDFVEKGTCPNCAGHNVLHYFEDGPVKEVCEDCHDINLELHNMKFNNVPVSLQILHFEHPIFSKELLVAYVFSEEWDMRNTEFTKQDIGKRYSIRGVMYRTLDNEAWIHSDDLELITPEDDDTMELVEESRDIPGYDEWRKEVLSRDKHCVVCGGDKHLHVHHLYGYKDYPDLRVDVSNGVTVCKFCHERYHSYYGLSDITPDKFIQFMRRFVVR